MHSKICSILCLASIAFASDILKEEKKEILELKRQQTQESMNSLKNSWINPLNLSFTYSKQNVDSSLSPETTSKVGKISLNQDLFRSGGIFYAVQNANAQKDLALTQIDMQDQLMNVGAYSLLAKLKKTDLQVRIMRLGIKNAQLDIDRKREQFMAGLTDVSFLNNAIISKTSNENKLLELLNAKEALLVSFKELSDKNYKHISLPKLTIPSKKDYLQNNLGLRVQEHTTKLKDSTKKLVRSSYLLRLSVNADYTKGEFERNNVENDDSFYGYAITLSMPLSINTFKDIEASKLDALVAQNELALLKEQENIDYDRLILDLKRIDKKIKLTNKDVELYDALLKQTNEQVQAGLKTSTDLEIMQNSRKMRIIDKEIYAIEKFEAKLEIYKNYASSI